MIVAKSRNKGNKTHHWNLQLVSEQRASEDALVLLDSLSKMKDCLPTGADANVARVPASGDSWYEIFVNAKEAAECAGPAVAVALGHSILVLKSLATGKECASLCQEATTFAQSDKAKQFECKPGRVRMPIKDALGKQGQSLSERILLRALKDIAPSIVPSLTMDLFGKAVVDSFATEGVVHNGRLKFSEGEPAINVYSPDGDFLPHKDKESLTLLVNLSEEDAYGGGGTGFFSISDLESGERTRQPNVTVTVRPPRGASILFAGNLMHAGLRVTSGSRCVFVASCSPTHEWWDGVTTMPFIAR